MERIQKVLAAAGVDSRRHCEELIKEGRVAVNGQVVTQMGVKVNPLEDVITVDGQAVPRVGRPVYLALNKPPGYLTALADDRGRATVQELISEVKERVFPVGRLDKDSEGLLLLTNDGELAYRLSHPRFGIEKEYLVLVKGEPLGSDLDVMRRGVEIEGRFCVPQAVIKVKGLPGQAVGKGYTWLCITLREGKKREVRRMCQAAGYPVLRLVRNRIGPIHLGNLSLGCYRFLTGDEVEDLRRSWESSGT